MISVNQLSVEFSAKPILSDISFFVNPSDKIALVGKNGAGKSTLLKILAGISSPSSGSVSMPTGLTLGYLPQQMNVADTTSLLEETKKIFNDRLKWEEDLRNIHDRISSFNDTNDPEFLKLLDRQDFLNNQILQNPLAEIESDIEKTLLGLGFSRTDFNRPTSEFSGGWRMRIELAKILLKKPDVLLLDEPTNHLDIESIQWLEQFIRNKAKAVILVSHDRAFLDNVTSRTIEISCGRIYDYKVSYSPFVQLRKERVEQQMRAYEKQQKEIADIKDFIERFRYKATKAVQVQSRIKQLEKIVPVEIDEVDKGMIHLKFPPAERSGDFPLILEGVGKSFGEHNVFSNAEFTLRRGEKVAFVGKNGEGKTTLVRCIMGDYSHDGTVKIGHNVKIGYFAQNQAQLLDSELTVFDTIDRVATGEIRNKINDLLGAFMFGGEASDKKVSVLSGGEKTRLAMIKLLLQPFNFLILDEPTNHLDLKTKDILKEAIKSFNGTVIVVSHDREFLDGLVEKVYEFGGGKVKEFLGGIYDYLKKKNIDSLNQLEIKGLSNHDIQGSPLETKNMEETETKSDSNLSYQEMKERSKKIKRLEKAIKDSENDIQLTEQRIQEIEDEFSNGNTDPELYDEYGTLKANLDALMETWESSQLELDNIKI